MKYGLLKALSSKNSPYFTATAVWFPGDILVGTERSIVTQGKG